MRSRFCSLIFSAIVFHNLQSCGKAEKSLVSPRIEEYFTPKADSKPCGPEGSFVSSLVPETWTGVCAGSRPTVEFSSSCVNHDSCYGFKGSNKDYCDNKFKENLKVECNLKFKVENCKESLTACEYIVKVYYDQVQLNGQSSFDKAQQK